MNRAWWLLVLGVPLTGCPFLFGPPELVATGTTSGAPTGSATGAPTGTATGVATGTGTGAATGAATGTATGAATGTATGAATGAPTGGTATGTTGGTNPPDPTPVVDNASARFGFAEAILDLGIEDPNADLVGGVVVVTGDAAGLFAIPGDLATFTPPGTLSLTLPVPMPCAGFSHSYTVQVTDQAGHVSDPVDVALVVTGVDHVPDTDPLDVGSLDLPAIACGDLSNSNDVDVLSFEPAQGGSWTFALTDATLPPKDRDLELLDGGGAVLASAFTANDPDTLQAGLLAGTTYQLRVSTTDAGGGSAWTVAIYP